MTTILVFLYVIPILIIIGIAAIMIFYYEMIPTKREFFLTVIGTLTPIFNIFVAILYIIISGAYILDKYESELDKPLFRKKK